MSIEALSGKAFLIITGASRGIGKQIAISFSSLLERGSHMLLLATNSNALKETAEALSANVLADTVSIDLSKATKEKLHEVIEQSLKGKTAKDFDRVIVVHNIGTLGNLTESTNDLTNFSSWHNYYDLNVFGPAILNSVAMQIFNENASIQKTVINVTSLMAVRPEKMMGYYCTGKAAREMFFKVFALENPQVNVLNYSPGPVKTDMYHKLCNEAVDQDIKTQFNNMVENKTVLTCEQTVNRLLTVLKEHKYKSGDHVDYYDEF